MKKIKFIEKTHQYLDEDQQDLISVSKFTERFKEKQDWGKIAAAYAKKHGLTKKEVQEKWNAKRDKSAAIGTLYHTIRENELIADDNVRFYNKKCKKILPSYDNGDKLSLPIHQLENDTVYPELMIYDTDFMICGQSDKVIVTDNKINIWDYKTDAEITFKAFSNQWVKPKKMLPPINHLEEANGNIYAIKMSLYMYLLWKANKGKFKPGEIIIEHVHLKRDPNNDNIAMLDKDGSPIVLKIEKIRLPYLKSEVIAMLNTIKKK